jgi:recombination protein RecR
LRIIPRSVERLVEEFGKLPSIGPRTAERLTFYLLRRDNAQAEALGQAVLQLKESLRRCELCFNLSEETICEVCQSSDRDATIVAVVEEPLDVVAIEKTGLYKGLYHVLGGVISPMDGIGPDQLQIHTLVERIKSQGIHEVILATNPVTEGEATAMYINKILEPLGVRVTRLARGLPVGGDLEYADQITLGRALQGRQNFE